MVAARILTETPAGERFPEMDFRVATTRGTNALLEHKGAKVGLFVNEGFVDLLEIRDQRREALFELRQPPYVSLAHRVYGLKGRLDKGGQCLEALDEADVRGQARDDIR